MGTSKGLTILSVLHFCVWVLWATLTLAGDTIKSKHWFNEHFGNHPAYSAFRWFEIFFMFGGGILLFILLTNVLKLKYWNYIIFELIFITIVIVNAVIYFS